MWTILYLLFCSGPNQRVPSSIKFCFPLHAVSARPMMLRRSWRSSFPEQAQTFRHPRALPDARRRASCTSPKDIFFIFSGGFFLMLRGQCPCAVPHVAYPDAHTAPTGASVLSPRGDHAEARRVRLHAGSRLPSWPGGRRSRGAPWLGLLG